MRLTTLAERAHSASSAPTLASPLDKPIVFDARLTSRSKAATWTPSHLSSLVGAKLVSVGVTKESAFTYDPVSPQFDAREMTFIEATNAICDATDSLTKYYLMQRSLPDEFPELAGDAELPAAIAPIQTIQTNLWFGSRGTVTPLHFDTSNNYLWQIYGRKKIRLFSPEQTKFLSPMPAWASYSHLSEIDLSAPDEGRFPLLTEVTGSELTLEPGEILYLPAFWWHHVTALDVSISVNMFWNSRANQHLAPNWLGQLPARYDRDRLTSLDSDLLISIAKAALDARIAWAQVLCASGALHSYYRARLRDSGHDVTATPNRLGLLHRLARQKDPARVAAVSTDRLARWTRLATLARQSDDKELPRAECDTMCFDIEHLLAFASAR